MWGARMGRALSQSPTPVFTLWFMTEIRRERVFLFDANKTKEAVVKPEHVFMGQKETL